MSKNEEGSCSTMTRLLVPALMFQAVAIGGAYATGREIIEFGAAYGALGWGAGAAMALLGAVLSFFVYETARRYRLFEYRAMTKHLIGRASWLFDAIYIPFSIVIMAVLNSATGNILKDTLGLDYWVGVSIIIAITAVVLFYGVEVVERFNGIGTVALIAGYLLFSFLVITSRWSEIHTLFSSGNHSLKPNGGIGDAILLGAIYAGLGFVVFPSTLVTVRHLRTRRESAIAALLTGSLYVVPWFLTYFALMGFYPSKDVFGAPVPWLVMLKDVNRLIVIIYGVLVGWTLAATAVGILYSIHNRIDAARQEKGHSAMSGTQRTALTLVILAMGAGLSVVGIIDLIAIGYMVGAIALIAVFGLPLLIKGIKLFGQIPIEESENTILSERRVK